MIKKQLVNYFLDYKKLIDNYNLNEILKLLKKLKILKKNNYIWKWW